MATYRRKPTTVEAFQWNGPSLENMHAMEAFLSPQHGLENLKTGTLTFGVTKSQSQATIQPGDWIIRETDGSGFYPCAADVFAATYEMVR